MRDHLQKENVLRVVVGLRPYRKGSIRLEVERRSPKLWVHNYGHGGSGITLCPGTARWVENKLSRTPGEIAVLGAGAVGLFAAKTLLEAGRSVTVYAEEFPPNTTSDLAGGLWAPTHVAVGSEELRNELLRWSWNEYTSLPAERYGVSKIHLYEAAGSPAPLDPMPSWLVGDGRSVDRLPFGEKAPGGVVWSTYLIQTGLFLRALVEDIERLGGRMERRHFSNVDQLNELPQEILVNCLGLGAGALLGDDQVVPIRGQLVYLKPMGEKMVLDHSGGYVISRDDALVLGGTFEEGVSDLGVCDETTEKILRGNRDFDW